MLFNFTSGIIAILVLIIDDLGYGNVGFTTGKSQCTPTIDALASSGAILNNLYSHPTCTPSRTAILTSKYASEVGMEHLMILRQQNYSLGTEVVTWPEHFQSHNISTALFGKYHLGSHEQKYTPHRRGFDYSVGYYGSSLGYYDHIERDGRDWFEQGKAQFDKADYGIYSSDILIDKLDQYLSAWDGIKPMFLYLATQVAHQPMELPPIRLNPTCAPIPQDNNTASHLIYNEMMGYLDLTVSDLLTTLDKFGLTRDNTVIFFSSDNNGIPEFGGMPHFRGEKGQMYDGGVHIPGFITGGQVKTGRYLPYLHLIDVIPTLLRLANWTVPLLGRGTQHDLIESDNTAIVSKAILLHLDWCEGICPFDWLCRIPCECPVKPDHFPSQFLTLALRYHRYKLIYHGFKLEFYDLITDEFETTNIIQTNPPVLKIMQGIAEDFYWQAKPLRHVPCDPTQLPVNGFWLPNDY